MMQYVHDAAPRCLHGLSHFRHVEAVCTYICLKYVYNMIGKVRKLKYRGYMETVEQYRAGLSKTRTWKMSLGRVGIAPKQYQTIRRGPIIW